MVTRVDVEDGLGEHLHRRDRTRYCTTYENYEGYAKSGRYANRETALMFSPSWYQANKRSPSSTINSLMIPPLRLIQVTIASSLLLACGSNSPSGGGQASAEGGGAPAAPSAAVARFASEEAANPDVGAARLEVRRGGEVSIPRDQLAVSDAFINDHPILVSKLSPGDYLVELLVAKSGVDERVAAVRVRVRNDQVATWHRVGIIAIDSGTGAFFDPRISSSITPAHVERFNERLLSALAASYRPTYSIAPISWEEMRFVAFSTGFGDGTYPVYLGSSVAGLPVTVLVDCEILPWRQ